MFPMVSDKRVGNKTSAKLLPFNAEYEAALAIFPAALDKSLFPNVLDAR